jgi:hypothetical protein
MNRAAVFVTSVLILAATVAALPRQNQPPQARQVPPEASPYRVARTPPAFVMRDGTIRTVPMAMDRADQALAGTGIIAFFSRGEEFAVFAPVPATAGPNATIDAIRFYESEDKTVVLRDLAGWMKREYSVTPASSLALLAYDGPSTEYNQEGTLIGGIDTRVPGDPQRMVWRGAPAVPPARSRVLVTLSNGAEYGLRAYEEELVTEKAADISALHVYLGTNGRIVGVTTGSLARAGAILYFQCDDAKQFAVKRGEIKAVRAVTPGGTR